MSGSCIFFILHSSCLDEMGVQELSSPPGWLNRDCLGTLSLSLELWDMTNGLLSAVWP